MFPFFTAIVALVAILFVYASTRPDTFEVKRSERIQASGEKVFALINELPAWEAWSPWARKDPDMKRTYFGPSAGVGAAMLWEGNREVGMGRMEITKAGPPRHLRVRLDFIKPFKAQNVSEFDLDTLNGVTEVTWSVRGPMPFFSKVVSVFVSMDRMIGKDFEAGLANLKAEAEK